jgi:hypothetical protein
LTFGLIHHRVEVSVEIPTDIRISPTVQTEWANEKEMKSSFLSAICIESTIVIIAL